MTLQGRQLALFAPADEVNHDELYRFAAYIYGRSLLPNYRPTVNRMRRKTHFPDRIHALVQYEILRLSPMQSIASRSQTDPCH